MSFAIGLIDHTAARASSARVARIYCRQWDDGQLGFVSQKLAKLRKTPTMQSVALTLSGPNPRADMRQFFYRDRKAVAFSRRNNLLTDTMIFVMSETGLLTREMLKATFCSFGAALLKTSTPLGVLRADPLNSIPRIGFSQAVEGKVDDTKIDTKDALDVYFLRVGDVTDTREVPLPPHKHEIGLSFAIRKELALTLAADKWNSLTPIERPDRNYIIGLETEDAVVEWLSRMFSEFNLRMRMAIRLVYGVGAGHFGYAADRYLGRNVELGSRFGIADLLQVILACFASLEATLGKPVAGRIAALKRLTQMLCLLLRWLKLNVSNELHRFKYRTNHDRIQSTVGAYVQPRITSTR